MELGKELTYEIVRKYTTEKVAKALTMAKGWNLSHAENMEFLEMAQVFTNNVVGLYYLYDKAEEGSEKRAKLFKILLKLLKPRDPKAFMDELDYMNKIIKKIGPKAWTLWQ